MGSRKLSLALAAVRLRLSDPLCRVTRRPWNLTSDQNERLSTLVRWNTPIVRAYYLKESFQLFWEYRRPSCAEQHIQKWMKSAMRSRLGPFKKFVRMLRSHLDEFLERPQARPHG